MEVWYSVLIDTHCHIHELYELPIAEVLERAQNVEVGQYVCVGTSEISSRQAIDFSEGHAGGYAAVGVHPHDTKDGYKLIAQLAEEGSDKLVAIGEIGLDYFYSHSPKEVQLQALKDQMELALKYDLPIIFHVREAFDDFWPLFEAYEAQFGAIKGVLHSFTDSQQNLEKAISKGLYIGVNGISTFTKDPIQQAMFDAIPLDRLIFETDAPFLTPAPYRGKVNEPAFIRVIADFHALRRGISLEEISRITTQNARALFSLPVQS